MLLHIVMWSFRCELSTESYRSTCRDLLSISHASPQLLDTRFPFDNNAVEKLKVLSMIGELPISAKCLDVLVHILCIIITPPCGPDTGLPVLICEESCRLYEQIKEAGICDAVDERSEQLAMFSNIEDFLTLVTAFKQFDCSNPATYFFINVTNPDPNLCTSLISPEFEGEFNRYNRDTSLHHNYAGSFLSELCELGVGTNCTNSTTTEGI